MSAPNVDPDRLSHSWCDEQDAELAIHLSRQVVDIVVGFDMPFTTKLALMEAAAEPLLDAPGGDPMLVYRTANSLSKEQQGLELDGHLSAQARFSRRVAISKLKGRGLHCAGRSDLAFNHCMAAMTVLQNLAGGWPAFLDIIARRPPNELAAATAEMFGLTCAALRRGVPHGSAARAMWTRALREMVDSFIPNLDPDSAPVYPGSPSAVQAMYLLADEGDLEDASRVDALRRFDMRVRHTHRRGQATIPLREVAYARYRGDTEASAAQSGLAVTKLEDHQLYRHLIAVRGHGLID
jgi:hypothetical protein